MWFYLCGFRTTGAIFLSYPLKPLTLKVIVRLNMFLVLPDAYGDSSYPLNMHHLDCRLVTSVSGKNLCDQPVSHVTFPNDTKTLYVYKDNEAE